MTTLGELKRGAAKLLDSVPYQQVKDSPSIKYYTDWSAFESCSPGEPLRSELDAQVIIKNGRLAKNEAGAVELGEDDALPINTIDLKESKMLLKHLLNVPSVVFIDVPPGAGKLGVLVESSGGGFESSHILINVRDGASVDISIIELGGACSSTVVESLVGRGAKVNLINASLQGGNPAYGLSRITALDNAVINGYTVVLDGSMNRWEEDYLLRGNYSSVASKVLEMGTAKSRIDYYSTLLHVGESTRSYSTVSGIALDKSMVIHRGMGRITETGKWSSTVVEGKMFMGSRDAVAVSVPVIAVDTGDVSEARHSAMDASIDEEQMFYLASRGLGREEAISLVAHDMVMKYLDEAPKQFFEEVQLIKSITAERLLKAR